jgi:hypothetical protein
VLRVRFEFPRAGEVFQLLERERRRSRTHHPQKPMLHQMNMQQALADRSVGNRRRMRFDRLPVLRVGPCLMRIEFVEI